MNDTERRPVGRPRLNDESKKSRMIGYRVTDRRWSEIHAKARIMGMSVTHFVTHAIDCIMDKGEE